MDNAYGTVARTQRDRTTGVMRQEKVIGSGVYNRVMNFMKSPVIDHQSKWHYSVRYTTIIQGNSLAPLIDILLLLSVQPISAAV